MAGTQVGVAMSGGVDSSVAALLLEEQGCEVFGLTARTWPEGSRCCSDEDVRAARRVCDSLGIPHYVVDLSDPFERQVVAYFEEEYLAGRTPSPCARCNRYIKFGELMQRALAIGADSMATGHYARTEQTPGGRIRLMRGVDQRKDQTYFLFDLSQEQLARSVFPVGGMTKEEVVGHARRAGLPAQDRPESQDLCFVAEGEHAALIEKRSPQRIVPGEIRDSDGRVLGRHGGIHRFTLGQRRGLGVAARVPLYVSALDRASATVVLGPRESLMKHAAVVSGVRWTSGRVPSGSERCEAKVRYRQDAAPAVVTPHGTDAAELRFQEPQFAITPGQIAAFYVGDELLGGGWIVKATR
jgi:tRNA-specific 2-thiouridylase